MKEIDFLKKLKYELSSAQFGEGLSHNLGDIETMVKKRIDELTEVKKVIPLYVWDGSFESYQVGDLEISRIDDKYFTSDMAEGDIQISDRTSLKSITKEQYEKYLY